MSARGSLQLPAGSSSTAIGLLADPPVRYIDGAAMDYFLIELVATLRHSSSVATARAKKIEQEMVTSGLIPAPNPVAAANAISKKEKELKEKARDSVASNASSRAASAAGGAKPALDEDEEAVRIRLESIGLHVGANFTERLCRDRPLFSETLDAIKFICKDVWIACWDKQVDNLRTNHRGVYVLQDNSFKPISRLSSWEGRPDAMRRAKLYVAVSAGIIRGALSRLGFHGSVTPEITVLPQCTFQIKLPKGTA